MITASEELLQRDAVVKRFRELLIQQHERLQNYLIVLENQRNSIESAQAEDILAYVDMEEQIIAEFLSVQKVIDPLEDMYRAAPCPENDIPSLKAVLEELIQQVTAQSARNRGLLSSRMEKIRTDIETLRKNPVTAGAMRSVYHNFNTASLVDIKG